MFVTKDRTRLYLSNWSYNSLLIINELAKIVLEKGGRIQKYRTAIISNRTIDDLRRDYSWKLSHLRDIIEKSGISDKRSEAINDLEQKLERLKLIDNSPIETIGQSWLRFVIGDKMYYYSFDDNPFFDFHYIKTTIDNRGEYSLDACCDVDDRTWLNDNFLYCTCTDFERQEAALGIFNMLMNARDSYVRVDRKRMRVANTYDHGYHYEYVCEKERRGKVDF